MVLLTRFDANCYIAITRKLDTHDISRDRGEYFDVLGQIKQPALIIGIASDGLFTVDEQEDLGKGIPNSQVIIIDSGEGHDGFLLEFVQMRRLLSEFIQGRVPELFEEGEPAVVDSGDLVSKPSVFGEAGDLLLW